MASIAGMVGVGFHTSVTVLAELAGVALVANPAVFLAIIVVLVVTAFRSVVHLFTMGCAGEGLCFGGVCSILF